MLKVYCGQELVTWLEHGENLQRRESNGFTVPSGVPQVRNSVEGMYAMPDYRRRRFEKTGRVLVQITC